MYDASETAPFSSSPLVTPFSIAPKILGMVLITHSPDLSIEQIQSVRNAVETHKLADESGMLVGFVKTNLKPLHIVAVPLTKLVVDRMPT